MMEWVMYVNQVGFPIVMSFLLWKGYQRNTEAINHLTSLVKILVDRKGGRR